MRRTFTPEFKAKLVLALLKEEKSAGQLAAEYDVHPTMLDRWRAAALAGLPSLFSDQAAQQQAAPPAAHDALTQQLYAEIGRLTTDLTWLPKKVADLTREQRLALVERAGGDRSLRHQTRLLALARAGLYYRPAAPSAKEVALKQRIDEIYTRFLF